ncbi:MAG TPA: putative ABC exporter domain-containing protein [Candidatus Acidoferrales bacterium]|nr:putative ABC exporter domain-containing protein [Candidatus Acidoferrales bacterium]
MIAALFYLQVQSTRNRLVTRFKRLKQPKYLIGAVAGGLYFYWYFYRYLFGGNGSGVTLNGTIPPEYLPLVESAGALLLLIIVVFAWLIPGDRAALTFTEAEVAFLFPAPVTRRNLVHFKLIRSQLRIFFTVLLLTLFTRRFGGNAWIHALGWWLILSTLSLHFLGASFTRTLLLDRGISNGRRRLVVFALVAGLVAVVWLWVRRTLPAPTTADTADFKAFADYAQQVLNTGPALYLLYPFHLLARPFLAPDATAFLMVIGPALLLLVLHYIWVAGSDVAFEEASLEASQKLAVRLAAVRSGNWQAAGKTLKPKRAWFKLTPAGPAAVALLWKNLIGVGRIFTPRLWIFVAVILVACFAGFGGSTHAQGLSTIVVMMIGLVLGYSLLLGPQLLRADFRNDLPMADVLKTFPLRGWQIALGEILAPVAVLASCQWLLLLFGFAVVIFMPVKQEPLVVAIGISAACLLPVLDFLLLLIPNAAVLLFPAWVQTGKEASRGIEATGQRLIMAIGQLLALVVALVPAALVFLAVYFPLKMAFGPIVPVPFAALAASLVVAAEAALGVILLGSFFERFDVTEETTR